MKAKREALEAERKAKEKEAADKAPAGKGKKDAKKGAAPAKKKWLYCLFILLICEWSSPKIFSINPIPIFLIFEYI